MLVTRKHRCADHLQVFDLYGAILTCLQQTDKSLLKFCRDGHKIVDRWELARQYERIEMVVQVVSGGEVDGLEDFREEKARQSSQVRAKIMMATDGIHIF